MDAPDDGPSLGMQAAGDQAAVTGAAEPAAARQLGAAARRRTSTRATSSAGRAAGGWAATEPEEEEAETLHSLREVNKRGCIYKTDWCQDARRNHVLGLRIVQNRLGPLQVLAHRI